MALSDSHFTFLMDWIGQHLTCFLQRLKNKIAVSESEDKTAKEKLKEVLPELGKLRTRLVPWFSFKHQTSLSKQWNAKVKVNFENCFVRTLEINRLLEEVQRDKAKLEGQCKDLTSDLKNKVGSIFRWDKYRKSNLNFEKLKRLKAGGVLGARDMEF